MSEEIRPSFSKAYAAANDYLASSSVIAGFPFSVKELVKEKTPYVCRSYKKAHEYGVDIEALGSESAIITTLGSRSVIFYDETKPESHINFSILHELGHKLLQHDSRDKRKESYDRYEIETNYFAAQLLMPEQLLREMQRRGVQITKSLLQSKFGVSAAAADKRIATLAKTNADWRSRAEKEFDDIVIYKYSEFLNRNAPVRDEYDYEEEFERQRERDSWY